MPSALSSLFSLFMKKTPDKVRQYLWVVVKIIILCATGWFVYHKIVGSSVSLKNVLFLIKKPYSQIIIWLIVLLFFTFLNWFFEILKWKTLVQTVKPISFSEAAKQSLYALTVSLATPNRIGEYGAKAFFFKHKKRKEVLLLTFFSGISQMAATVFFGFIGVIIMGQKFTLIINKNHLFWFFLILFILIIFSFVFRKKQFLFKGLSVKVVFNKVNSFSKAIWIKTIGYSFIRYIVFSCMFYIVLQFYDVPISLLEAIPIIFTTYLLVSIIPSFFILDVVVRGGVAIFLFGLAGIPETEVAVTVLTMWFFNFVLPAILGGYFMFSYQPLKK